MFYYADTQRRIQPRPVLGKVVEDLRSSREASLSLDDQVSIDHYPLIVGALIALGEIHQGVADQLSVEEDQVSDAADRIARAGVLLGRCLYRSWKVLSAAGRSRDTPDRPSISCLLRVAECAVDALTEIDLPESITTRVPEGFAFYSLYPEMYFASLARLVIEEPSPGGYFVIGIRSIGTSLSALVAGALVEQGFATSTETVRPRGHPFDRYLHLSPGLRDRFRAVPAGVKFIIVDEGPGLTCSSILSVCRYLEQLAIPGDRVTVMTAWAGAPSIYASEDLRTRWSKQRVYWTGTAQALQEWTVLLPFVSRQLALQRNGDGTGLPSQWKVTDVSYGRWRELLYPAAESWPAIHRPSERTKLLISTGQHPPSGDSPPGGGGRPATRYLAKFAGLGDYGVDKLRRATILAEAGFAPPVVGLAYGFLVHQFVEGRPLTRSDLSPVLLQRMVEYYAFIWRNFRRPPESRFDQMAEMVIYNSQQATGEDATAFVKRWRVKANEIDSLPLVALDGRPFPHEWIVREGGSGHPYLKTDGADHARDHTIVGEQCIIWDLAGACEEWGMDSGTMAGLLDAWEYETGDRTARRYLEFYRSAYLAYRTAALHYAIHSTDEADVRETLQRCQHEINCRLRSLI